MDYNKVISDGRSLIELAGMTAHDKSGAVIGLGLPDAYATGD